MSTSEVQQHVEEVDPHDQYLHEDVLQNLGDIIVADGASVAKRLAIGNPYEVLIVSVDTPNQPQWAYIGVVAIPRGAMLHKGDILVGTGNGGYAVLSAGPDGYVLTTDSSAITGLRWTPDGTLCPYSLDFSYECDSGYLAVL